jgi:hypothetical protein
MIDATPLVRLLLLSVLTPPPSFDTVKDSAANATPRAPGTTSAESGSDTGLQPTDEQWIHPQTVRRTPDETTDLP